MQKKKTNWFFLKKIPTWQMAKQTDRKIDSDFTGPSVGWYKKSHQKRGKIQKISTSSIKLYRIH